MDERKNQVDEITAKIPEAIAGFMKEDAYQEFLKAMAKFNSRSINNCILIACQRPDATFCEGFNAWKNKFDRTVKKGSKGIKIIQPAPYKKVEMVDKLDAEGNKLFDKNGEPVQEKVEKIIQAYKVGYVFAYEDTEGTPLPEVCNHLEATVDNYERFMDGLKTISPVPIIFEKIDSGANGYFHLETKDIHIKDDLPQLQTIKTIIHEIAHSIMHDKDNGIDKQTNRREREVEAESVAYTVASYYGLDTSGYSFGYIAGWSKDKELPELKERLEMIRATSNTIISKLDEHFLLQDLNQKSEMIFKNGTEYVRVWKEVDGWNCTLYDANLVRSKEHNTENPEMKMNEAINYFCTEMKLNRGCLIPTNGEHIKPILQRADEIIAVKEIEEKALANTILRTRHI